jgi:hypothetical protein
MALIKKMAEEEAKKEIANEQARDFLKEIKCDKTNVATNVWQLDHGFDLGPFA